MQKLAEAKDRFFQRPVRITMKPFRFLLWVLLPTVTGKWAFDKEVPKRTFWTRWQVQARLRLARPSFKHYALWIRSLKTTAEPTPPRWARRAMRPGRRKKDIPDHIAELAGEAAFKPRRVGGLGPKYWLKGRIERDIEVAEPRWGLLSAFSFLLLIPLLVGFVGRSIGERYIAPKLQPSAVPDLEEIQNTTTITTYVGNFTKNTGTGNQDITTYGSGSSLPDISTAGAYGTWLLVLTVSGSTGSSSTWGAAGYGSTGLVANGPSGTISQYSFGRYSADAAVGAAVENRRMAAKALTAPDVAGTGTRWETGCTALAGGGFRLDWATNAGGAEVVCFQLITGLTNAIVINWTAPTTAITKTVTGVGFTPDLAIHLTGFRSGALPSDATTGGFGIGVANKHGQQWSTSVYSATGATSNTSRWQQTDACIIGVDASEGKLFEAQHQSFNSDGEVLNFADMTAAAAYDIATAYVAGCSSKVGSFTKTTAAATATQTVTWAKDATQGGTARGLLFMDTSRVPNVSPGSHITWGFGFTDGANDRSVGLGNTDNVGTTVAKSVWYSGNSVLCADTGGAVQAVGSYTGSTTTTFGLSFTTNNATAIEILYLVIFDSGTNTFPNYNLDTATTNTAATAYSNQKKVAVLTSGRMVRVVGETTTNARFEWSDTGLAGSWTDYEVDIAGWSNGSLSEAYTDSGGTQRLIVAWKQSGTGGGRSDLYSYVMVGTFNAGATTLTWGTAGDISGADTNYNYHDISVLAEGTGGVAHMVCDYRETATNHHIQYQRWDIDSAGVRAFNNAANLESNFGVDVATYPSVCIDPSTKRVHIVGSGGTTGVGKGIRYKTMAYSAGSWSNAAAMVEVDNTRYYNGAQSIGMIRWNSHDSMAVIGGPSIYDGTNQDLVQYELVSPFTSVANTRVLDDNVTGANQMNYGSLAIDSATGDSYYTGRSLDGNSISYRKWVRATTTLGANVITDEGPSVGAYSYAWNFGSAIWWTYTSGNNSPYIIALDKLSLASAPNAPTLTAPANAAYLDATSSITFTGTYNSTDAANQNAYALRVKVSGGSYSYYNAGTGLWQGTIVWNTVVTVPAASWSVVVATSSTIANGNNYSWSLASQEANASLQGAFATDFAFTAQAGPSVTINAPTGTVVTSTAPTVTWTATPASGAVQTAYEIVVYSAAQYGAGGWTAPSTATGSPVVGSPNIVDTGVLTVNTNTWSSMPTLTNGTTYRVYLAVQETGGQWSSFAVNTFTISLDPPAIPTLTLTASTDGTTGVPRLTILVQGRDNLLTTNQASLETDTTGWAAGTSTSIARTTSQTLDGVASLQLTRNTTTGTASATTPTGTSGQAVIAATQYTAMAYFKSAVTARNCDVAIVWYNAAGSVISTSTGSVAADSTSGWTQAYITATSPALSAFAAVVVEVASAIATEVHYVDEISLALGASTTWTRGGLNGITTALIQYSDDSGTTWTTVRNYSALALSGTLQQGTGYDYEGIPNTARLFRASISAVVGGSTITGTVSSSYSGTVTYTDWYLKDPTNTAYGILIRPVGSQDTTRSEQSSAFYLLGRSKPVVVSDVINGQDGSLLLSTYTVADYTALQAMMALQDVLLLQSPFSEQWYVRVTAEGRAQSLKPSTGNNPYREVRFTYYNVDTP